ncbi:hypothetical protein HN51_038706 [Arachis hypogaea]|uniref:Omega-hydroxypalmitate O-feruloyl transferase n=1 Tax=Arachis hypogaea TaxID=3818 RepID=A0A444YGI1_ARAHY|nr:fatty alcohol:caffeoyl-CoA acyltransferase [Arachis hypogaea]QHN84115.1 Omega-hydroxypalmitate O-feruloyl transferase [Arachis hypogaea]RYR00999.1 hypothetical protein Ahy_B06g079866 isoform C [Arachis hypogaea]
MLEFVELPDCFYPRDAITIITPCAPTPKHSLYLSNLDDQKFLRFSIKYLYLFKKSVSIEALKCSLSRVLVDYYPLAGRLRKNNNNDDDDHKLEVDCNGEGAVLAEAFMDSTIEDLIEASKVPNKSWRKLMYKVEAQSFLDIPPLVLQVTNLRCGGMILCTAINHCLCDGIGTSQFLHAWAQLTKNPNTKLTIIPFHGRHVLKSRDPPQVRFPLPGYTKTKPTQQVELLKLMQSQPLVATSFTFGSHQVLQLKKQCIPSLKCTTFEVMAAHTWRSWIGSLNLNSDLTVKLLFSINIRKSMNLPQGYYGNGFVLGCAQSKVKDLVCNNNNNNNNNNNLHHGVKLVQQAKATTWDNNGEYIRSMIDFLEDKNVRTDLSASMVISQWSKLGLEDLDFGEGKPLHMGPLTSDVYCLFLPVVGDADAVRVLVSVPESMVESFRHHMMVKESWESHREKNNEDVNTNGYHVEEKLFV